MNILVLHGPNLNLLGEREPEVYGSGTLAELDRALRTEARRLGQTVRIQQSNHEGVLIDRLHAARHWADGVVFNPGAYTHTSYALRDAIAAIRPPVVEVHLSDIRRREPFRRRSVVADVAAHRILGLGFESYLSALRWLAARPPAARPPARQPAAVQPRPRRPTGRGG